MLDERYQRGVADVAVLAEPTRRRLYRHVADQAAPVSRDDVAAATGITRSLAAFHLDRLVSAGLLETEFRRLSGRTGPGAGRPAKLYRVARNEVRATLPARRYEVAAELFAEALTARSGGPEAVPDAAAALGAKLGAEARRRAGRRPSAQRRLDALQSVLRDAGYVPFVEEGEIRLLNCPFHELAQRHRQLTCGMNLAMLRGMLDAAGLPPDAARLDSRPGLCCVGIETEG